MRSCLWSRHRVPPSRRIPTRPHLHPPRRGLSVPGRSGDGLRAPLKAATFTSLGQGSGGIRGRSSRLRVRVQALRQSAARSQVQAVAACAVVFEIVTSVYPTFAGPPDLQCSRSPDSYALLQLLELSVVNRELVSTEPREAIEHVDEHRGTEPRILGQCQLEQALEPESSFDSHEIHVVPGFGPTEYGKHLVRGQFLTRQHGEPWTLFDRQKSRIGRQVQFGGVIGAGYRQPREPRVLQDPLDLEAGNAQCTFRRRNQPVNRFRIESEEVEIPRPPVDIASNDECRPAGQSEACSLG